MLFVTLFTWLACGFASAASASSQWATIRTDQPAWLAACGQSRRVGAVCIDVRYHDPSAYRVESDAQQNTVFSANNDYLHAYCPNLDINDKPYTITYGTDANLVYFHILGRRASEQCCRTIYVSPHDQDSSAECVQPAKLSGVKFPASP